MGLADVVVGLVGVGSLMGGEIFVCLELHLQLRGTNIHCGLGLLLWAKRALLHRLVLHSSQKHVKGKRQSAMLFSAFYLGRNLLQGGIKLLSFFTACCTFLWCFGFLWKFCNYQTLFSNWRVTGAQMLSGLKNLACVAVSAHSSKPDWLLVHLSQFEVERIERLCKCYRSEPRLPLRLSGFQSDRLKSHLWVGDYQQMCSQATQLELPRIFHGPIALRYRRRWHLSRNLKVDIEVSLQSILRGGPPRN